MSNPSLTDLFEESSDPHAYIPRRATEEVLKCVSALVRDSEPVIVLHGPAGIGKSMLLQVLRERFDGERRVAYASVGEVPEPELCHRVLDELSEPEALDPAQALIRAASDGQSKLLLLIDHPNLAPVASSLQLAAVAKSAAPYVTVVFAIADDVGAQQFARALSVEASVTTLAFDQAMDSKEAGAYVRLRLARTELPAALRDQLDERAMNWLTEGAQAGLPREINRRAAELLRSFEEGGQDALRIPVQASDSIASDDVEPQTAAPRAIDPSSYSGGSLIDPTPPSFPMRSGDALDPGAAGPVGGGSLGGMLLGSGPGAKPNFEINLELGRSLSSGLLDGRAKRPSSKDGQPVTPEEAAAAAALTAKKSAPAEPQARNRRGLMIAASFTAFAIGSGYLATRDSAEPELIIPDEVLLQVDPAQSLSDEASTATTPVASIAPTAGDSEDTAATDDSPTDIGVRPSLAEGPMGDAAQLAVKASTKKVDPEVVAAVEPPKTIPIKLQTPTPTPPRRVVQPATSPIVLPSRANVGDAASPNSYVRLSIDVEPGSEITVDGESIGIAPFSEIFVEMGTHTFVAEMPDGIRVEQLVDVQVGTDIVEF